MEKQFTGVPVSGGVGVGKVRYIDCSCPAFMDRTIYDTDRELGRFVRTLKIYCNKTCELMDYIRHSIGISESHILAGHIQMTHDPRMQAELIRKIGEGKCAERATREICDDYITQFLGADVEFVRLIATDVLDVEGSMVRLLMGLDDIDVEDFGEDTIVVSRELTPSVVARLDRKHTKGIITHVGSRKSHGAVLAKAMNIPSVIRVENIESLFSDGDVVTVDGNTGEFFCVT